MQLCLYINYLKLFHSPMFKNKINCLNGSLVFLRIFAFLGDVKWMAFAVYCQSSSKSLGSSNPATTYSQSVPSAVSDG